MDAIAGVTHKLKASSQRWSAPRGPPASGTGGSTAQGPRREGTGMAKRKEGRKEKEEGGWGGGREGGRSVLLC